MVCLRLPPTTIESLLALRIVPNVPQGILDGLPADPGQVLIDHLLLVRTHHWSALEGVGDSLLACSLDAASYTLPELVKDAEPEDPSLDAEAKERVLASVLANSSVPKPVRHPRAIDSKPRSVSGPSPRFQIATERQVGPDRTLAQEWRETGRELTAVVNVLVSMFAVATAAWWASAAFGRAGTLVARASDGLGLRVIFSLLASLGIGAIESWLYWRVFSRKDEHANGPTRAKDGRQALRIRTNGSTRPRRTQSDSNIQVRLSSPLNPSATAVNAIGLSSSRPEPLRRASSYRGRGDALRMRAIAGERARREAELRTSTLTMSYESRKLR